MFRARTTTATILGLALVAAGCTSTPSATPVPGQSGSAATETIVAFFVHSYESRFFVTPEVVEVAELTPDARVAAVLAGPRDQDLFTAYPDGAEATVSVSGGVAAVDWNEAVLDTAVGASAEAAAVQQIVWTLAQIDGVNEVRFTVNGATTGEVSGGGRLIEDWWGHTALADLPLTPDTDVLAPITIDDPQEGDVVSGRVTVSGEATVFEANVQFRLRRPDGTVTQQGFTTASEGAPGRGTWEATFTLPKSGKEQAWIIEAFEESAKDGSIAYLATRTVTIG